MIQYFGAYERKESSQNTRDILEANQSVLVSPGGKVDTLAPPSYDINWPLGFMSDLKSPLVVPVSVVGFNDMISVLKTVDFTPLFWILGYKTEPKSAAIPIFFFQSFERSYVNLGPINNYSEEEIVEQVENGICKVLETQSNDPNRIRLKSVSSLIDKSYSLMKPIFVKLQPIVHRASLNLYAWAVDALDKMD
jgi:hypothetical protein